MQQGYIAGLHCATQLSYIIIDSHTKIEIFQTYFDS